MPITFREEIEKTYQNVSEDMRDQVYNPENLITDLDTFKACIGEDRSHLAVDEDILSINDIKPGFYIYADEPRPEIPDVFGNGDENWHDNLDNPVLEVRDHAYDRAEDEGGPITWRDYILHTKDGAELISGYITDEKTGEPVTAVNGQDRVMKFGEEALSKGALYYSDRDPGPDPELMKAVEKSKPIQYDKVEYKEANEKIDAALVRFNPDYDFKGIFSEYDTPISKVFEVVADKYGKDTAENYLMGNILPEYREELQELTEAIRELQPSFAYYGPFDMVDNSRIAVDKDLSPEERAEFIEDISQFYTSNEEAKAEEAERIQGEAKEEIESIHITLERPSVLPHQVETALQNNPEINVGELKPPGIRVGEERVDAACLATITVQFKLTDEEKAKLDEAKTENAESKKSFSQDDFWSLTEQKEEPSDGKLVVSVLMDGTGKAFLPQFIDKAGWQNQFLRIYSAHSSPTTNLPNNILSCLQRAEYIPQFDLLKTDIEKKIDDPNVVKDIREHLTAEINESGTEYLQAKLDLLSNYLDIGSDADQTSKIASLRNEAEAYAKGIEAEYAKIEVAREHIIGTELIPILKEIDEKSYAIRDLYGKEGLDVTPQSKLEDGTTLEKAVDEVAGLIGKYYQALSEFKVADLDRALVAYENVIPRVQYFIDNLYDAKVQPQANEQPMERFVHIDDLEHRGASIASTNDRNSNGFLYTERDMSKISFSFRQYISKMSTLFRGYGADIRADLYPKHLDGFLNERMKICKETINNTGAKGFEYYDNIEKETNDVKEKISESESLTDEEKEQATELIDSVIEFLDRFDEMIPDKDKEIQSLREDVSEKIKEITSDPEKSEALESMVSGYIDKIDEMTDKDFHADVDPVHGQIIFGNEPEPGESPKGNTMVPSDAVSKTSLTEDLYVLYKEPTIFDLERGNDSQTDPRLDNRGFIDNLDIISRQLLKSLNIPVVGDDQGRIYLKQANAGPDVAMNERMEAGYQKESKGEAYIPLKYVQEKLADAYKNGTEITSELIDAIIEDSHEFRDENLDEWKEKRIEFLDQNFNEPTERVTNPDPVDKNDDEERDEPFESDYDSNNYTPEELEMINSKDKLPYVPINTDAELQLSDEKKESLMAEARAEAKNDPRVSNGEMSFDECVSERYLKLEEKTLDTCKDIVQKLVNCESIHKDVFGKMGLRMRRTHVAHQLNIFKATNYAKQLENAGVKIGPGQVLERTILPSERFLSFIDYLKSNILETIVLDIIDGRFTPGVLARVHMNDGRPRSGSVDNSSARKSTLNSTGVERKVNASIAKSVKTTYADVMDRWPEIAKHIVSDKGYREKSGITNLVSNRLLDYYPSSVKETIVKMEKEGAKREKIRLEISVPNKNNVYLISTDYKKGKENISVRTAIDHNGSILHESRITENFEAKGRDPIRTKVDVAHKDGKPDTKVVKETLRNGNQIENTFKVTGKEEKQVAGKVSYMDDTKSFFQKVVEKTGDKTKTIYYRAANVIRNMITEFSDGRKEYSNFDKDGKFIKTTRVGGKDAEKDVETGKDKDTDASDKPDTESSPTDNEDDKADLSGKPDDEKKESDFREASGKDLDASEGNEDDAVSKEHEDNSEPDDDTVSSDKENSDFREATEEDLESPEKGGEDKASNDPEKDTESVEENDDPDEGERDFHTATEEDLEPSEGEKPVDEREKEKEALSQEEKEENKDLEKGSEDKEAVEKEEDENHRDLEASEAEKNEDDRESATKEEENENPLEKGESDKDPSEKGENTKDARDDTDKEQKEKDLDKDEKEKDDEGEKSLEKSEEDEKDPSAKENEQDLSNDTNEASPDADKITEENNKVAIEPQEESPTSEDTTQDNDTTTHEENEKIAQDAASSEDQDIDDDGGDEVTHDQAVKESGNASAEPDQTGSDLAAFDDSGAEQAIVEKYFGGDTEAAIDAATSELSETDNEQGFFNKILDALIDYIGKNDNSEDSFIEKTCDFIVDICSAMADGLINMVESAIEGLKEYFQDFANLLEGEIPMAINDISSVPTMEANLGDSAVNPEGELTSDPVASPEEAGEAVLEEMQGFDVGEGIQEATEAAEQSLQDFQQNTGDVAQDDSNPVGAEDFNNPADQILTDQKEVGEANNGQPQTSDPLEAANPDMTSGDFQEDGETGNPDDFEAKPGSNGGGDVPTTDSTEGIESILKFIL